ncbi:heavy metal translocating P-type ATPase [Vagococcus elongatus]|uniref:P-type Cu(+) transporter n=1 Tax=Vagococcus elongatus TaxID=180344 RepID=A0A430B271_9ENTE|nr:heavy metal translocating P-type ATPase [Vagococcus elongatus]RSU14351.1 copper-translocating P-type ATPase [Vagococcus elongatus]
MKQEHQHHEEHASHAHQTNHEHGMKHTHEQPTEHHNHNDGHHGNHHTGHAELFKKKFFHSLFLGIPILIMSPMMGISLPFQITFPGSDWIVLILATILYFYGGAPFISGAKDELSQKKPAMMTLISLGISVAYFYSLYAFAARLIFHHQHFMDFFWELASLIIIMLLGHWIEMNAIGNAGNALQKMAELLPNEALLQLDDGKTKMVPLNEVQLTDKVIVHAGENIPVDGIVVNGESTVNESLLTGEAKAVKKSIGEQVIGGSTNGSGSLTIEVSATGESGYLSQVMTLVSDAQKEKSMAENLSDRIAGWLFYIALIIGLLAFVVWLSLTKDVNIALERLVTVLIIACPHALGLAVPLVVARTTSLGAQNGLLIKNRQALEIVPAVDVILMDKTGTLTEGNFTVNKIASFEQAHPEKEILRLFAGLESFSSHPLAVGIVDAAKKEALTLPQFEQINTIAGTGIIGTYQQKNWKIVNAKYLDQQNLTYDKESFMAYSQLGNSISYLLENDSVVGMIAQGDQIKPDAKNMIDSIKQRGITPVMLTGDNQQVAELVAEQLGIEEVHSELHPEEKDQIIQSYKNNHQRTMMIGDGINDAPSLARADVGVAIGAGTDVAIDSADIILVRSDPSDILHLLSLAANTNRKMKQNLWWGAGYNLVALPVAAGILAPIGIMLSPAVGAVLMSASTVIVAFNALLLKLD